MDIPSSASLWLSKRFFVAFVLFLCFVNFQVLRNNVNITVVEMTSNKTITRGNLTITSPPDFNWDSITIGLVLSILAYGGLLSFFGGFLVDWLGGAVNCSLCLFVAGTMTILHPAALYLDFRLFLACRFVTGVFESFFYVSTADIFARWFPKNERSTLISFSFNGTNVGVAVVYPFCGYLANTWGWQVVFYVTGGISMLSAVICITLIKNRPSQDRWISKKELDYILEETETSLTEITEINHPYKSIFTSGPVWAICMVVFAYMWINTVVGSCLPLYLKDMTQKSTDEIGLITSIPNIVFIITFPIAGVLMSYWDNCSKLSVSRIHKIMMTFACVTSTISLVVITLITDFAVSLISVIVIQIVTSFMALIIEIVPVSLHADSGSIIVGMISVFLSVGAIVSQSATSLIVTNHTMQEWNDCFLLASSILLLTAVIFAIYGSSEPQTWTPAPVSNDNHRPSIITVHFQSDSGRTAIRSIGLNIRRVSINNSEVQTRMRRLSLRTSDMHGRSRKHSLEQHKGERKLSLGNSSSKYERRLSASLVEFHHEEFNKRNTIHEEEEDEQHHHQQQVILTIEYVNTATSENVKVKPIPKSESEPSLGKLAIGAECPRKGSFPGPPSIKYEQFFGKESALPISNKNLLECPGGNKRRLSAGILKFPDDKDSSRKSSIKSVQFSDDEHRSSIGNSDCSKDQSRSSTPDNNNSSRKSSIKSVQFSDDEHGSSISSSGSSKDQRRSSIKRSSMRNTRHYDDGERSPSTKSVQFQYE
ncbi:sialin-like isoform X2 [Planococcus citri]|uniref:sialin-like isoform X2 n=1 Tax=Planococcus citri TaxID=170843 RepID=UPI0031F8BF25